jgi:hypothetical protein
LGNLQSLPEFLSGAAKLTQEEMATIAEQAIVMIEQTYVHLPLKRAMYAIEPVQRLRLLKQRLDNYSERAFHNEMISTFVHLRDRHTTYFLPEAYLNSYAFLPFHIEECFEPVGPKGELAPQYLVTRVMGELSDPRFKSGVVVTHWNGIPIANAVEINADREAGSNLDARHARGLETMTLRWMGTSLPPDEEWVAVRYRPDARHSIYREARFDWSVIQRPPASWDDSSVPVAIQPAAIESQSRLIGIDTKAEMERRVRKLLFAPAAVSAQQKMADLGARASDAAQAFHDQVMMAPATAQALVPEVGTPARRGKERVRAKASRRIVGSPSLGTATSILEGVDLAAQSVMPDAFKQFGKVTSPKGTFGYIRIVTFAVPDPTSFINEFIRIATLLPEEGLIVDVRGNGGGMIPAAEGLLQTMTPAAIEPQRFNVLNTPLILQLCEHDDELAPWTESVREAIETGSIFSQGFPLTTAKFCNKIGQKYQGPVVLVVDAGAYSATDIFAAGFQDHKIGVVLGTSGHTGAGGASVWDHSLLEQLLPSESSPLKPIPSGASFRVAIRRSTRVGPRAGELLEDLGVTPDRPVYKMTRNDILNHNVDLIQYACGILADMPRQRLAASCQRLANGSFEVTVSTTNIQRVDVLFNGRPLQTLDVRNGLTSINVALPSQLPEGDVPASVLQCRGFRREKDDWQLAISACVQL